MTTSRIPIHPNDVNFQECIFPPIRCESSTREKLQFPRVESKRVGIITRCNHDSDDGNDRRNHNHMGTQTPDANRSRLELELQNDTYKQTVVVSGAVGSV